ncbi:hypothetical protein EJ08DRAFT_697650 [Tothia fuscella]|uniref:Uncharacterized protein n=1 Tax=Tothia fuscella TaxID=1048955 RepID=A0A9P4NQB1_9PEZI|nr:hypothetical protein EJ08DRAFT_697650 [Tothia fuscella]
MSNFMPSQATGYVPANLGYNSQFPALNPNPWAPASPWRFYTSPPYDYHSFHPYHPDTSSQTDGAPPRGRDAKRQEKLAKDRELARKTRLKEWEADRLARRGTVAANERGLESPRGLGTVTGDATTENPYTAKRRGRRVSTGAVGGGRRPSRNPINVVMRRTTMRNRFADVRATSANPTVAKLAEANTYDTDTYDADNYDCRQLRLPTTTIADNYGTDEL